MKIIDFDKKGNVVRFFLGRDDLTEWHGDDWCDTPYEHNAGPVYDNYISGYVDIAFDYECLVLEPQDDWYNQGNSRWCKKDMVERRIPCVIIVPPSEKTFDDDFGSYVGNANVIRCYFGDDGALILNSPYAHVLK